ncbi:MAG TPA: hypothetical protein DEA44_11055 [Firmicutes bacterium]|nr:hypothetical protein [Bacillota bacterium]
MVRRRQIYHSFKIREKSAISCYKMTISKEYCHFWQNAGQEILAAGGTIIIYPFQANKISDYMI